MDVVFELPGGMMVSNKKYNEVAIEQRLVTRIDDIGSKFNNVSQTHFIVSFDAVVVGSDEIILADDGGGGNVGDLTSACAGMSFNENDEDDTDEEDDRQNTEQNMEEEEY
jgi:hypothetical protein